MNNNFQPAASRNMLAIGSVLLVTVLCVFFIGFVQQFIDYALNMFYLAARATTNYLQITPVLTNH